MISIKLLSKFIEITLQHGRSPVNWLHIFRIPFPKNTHGGLLLHLLFTNADNNNDNRTNQDIATQQSNNIV